MNKASRRRALEAEQPAGRRLPLQTFTSLKYRDFRLLWIGSFFTSTGQWMQQVTLGWLVWELSHSPLMVGLVSSSRWLPFLVVAPLGGVAADRFDRRIVLMVMSFVMALSALSFAVIVLLGIATVWHALAYSILMGTVWALASPLRQALVANTVPQSDLMNGIALQTAAFNITRIAGPAVGGFLIVFFGTATNFYIQSAAYVAAILLVFPMRLPFREAPAPRAPALASLKEGAVFVLKDKALLSLISMAFIPSFFVLPLTQLMPVFAASVFHGGSDKLGILLAAFGVGGLVGTMTVASIGNVRNKGALALASLVGTTAGLIVFAQSRWFLVSLGVLALLGALQMTFRMANNTLVQSRIPDALRGRVMSIYMMEHGFTPAGSLVMGGLTESLGAALAVTILGGLGLLVAVALNLRLPSVRRLS